MNERDLPFAAIDNARDYGGYAIVGGGRLRGGRLYRSGHLNEASDADLAAIDALGLVAIVDLRGPSERTRVPSRLPAGFAAPIVSPELETAKVAPHIEAAVKVAGDESAAHAAMEAVYAALPVRADIIAALRGYFDTLIAADGPSLIHCAAGKDRTGVAVALFHLAVGVHRDDAVADYLLTNSAGRAEERLTHGAALVRRQFGNIDEVTARALVRVAPRFLDTSIAAAEAAYGSLDAYFEQAIGLTPARREALRARVIL